MSQKGNSNANAMVLIHMMLHGLAHLFMAQLDLTLLNNIFFVQQLLLLTLKVIFAL